MIGKNAKTIVTYLKAIMSNVVAPFQRQNESELVVKKFKFKVRYTNNDARVSTRSCEPLILSLSMELESSSIMASITCAKKMNPVSLPEVKLTLKTTITVKSKVRGTNSEIRYNSGPKPHLTSGPH